MRSLYRRVVIWHRLTQCVDVSMSSSSLSLSIYHSADVLIAQLSDCVDTRSVSGTGGVWLQGGKNVCVCVWVGGWVGGCIGWLAACPDRHLITPACVIMLWVGIGWCELLEHLQP
jgi:hypothetical protein